MNHSAFCILILFGHLSDTCEQMVTRICVSQSLEVMARAYFEQNSYFPEKKNSQHLEIGRHVQNQGVNVQLV